MQVLIIRKISYFRSFAGESLGIENWTPYLESLRPNFTNEANFAISGSSALPGLVPFSLSVQVLQFLRFRTRSLELISKGTYAVKLRNNNKLSLH